MARDGESALFFQSGDEAMLAEQIRRVFIDDDLAQRLSEESRTVARIRHSKDKIMSNMLDIYNFESVRKDSG